MRRPSTLRRRIVTTYLFFALAMCAFFGTVATVAIEGIEDLLVDEHLHSVAQWAMPRHAQGLPVETASDESFYHGASIPPELRNLPLGVSKIEIDGSIVHVLVGEDGSDTYVVLDRASEYKSIEHVIFAMIMAGFLGFVALSLLLGSFIARGFVDPIIELAEAVMQPHNNNLENTPDLPLLNSKDELGILSRAFAAHTAELKQFLARERFFTGDVSHELRTPLTIIIGAAELLVEQTPEHKNLQASSLRILKAAKDATDCVETLLLLARAPDHISRPQTSISAVIRAEVARCEPLLTGKNVTLHFEEGDDFFVAARKELLTAAIGNLIRNACQYTERGSVTVLLESHSVIVKDTGPGLPEAVQNRLRNDPSAASLVGSAGSGLGLALVVRICEYLDAKLNVENLPGIGSNFRIVFKET